MLKKKKSGTEAESTLPAAVQGKKKKKTPWIVGGIVLVIILILVIVPRMMPEGLPKVPVDAVTSGDITAYIDASGSVESLKTKTYFSPVNAPISQYPRKVGEVVKPGDMLVAFNTETLEQDNQKAQLNVSATVNGSNDSVAKASETQQKANAAAGRVPALQNDVDNFQNYIASLKTAIADRTRALSQNASQSSADINVALTRAQADLQKKQTELEGKVTEQTKVATQIEQLKNESMPDVNSGDNVAGNSEANSSQKEVELKKLQEQYDKLQTEIDRISNEVSAKGDEVTELQVKQIEAQSASDPSSDAQIVAWQNEMESASTELADLQSELAEQKSIAQSGEGAQITKAAKAQMEATNNIAELEAASLEELLEKGKKGLQAEFSGIVSKADSAEGSVTSQGMELITVASNEEVAVNTTISKYDYDKLKEGQKATITIADNTYKGTVSRISKMATTNEKGAPVIWAEVKIDNPDDNIFLGVEAKVSIETGSVKDAVRVPVNAVNTGKDSTFCYVVKDGVITRQDVSVGLSSSEYTEIKSGLKVGDAVLSVLPDGFQEGMKVEAAGADEIEGGAIAAEKE